MKSCISAKIRSIREFLGLGRMLYCAAQDQTHYQGGVPLMQRLNPWLQLAADRSSPAEPVNVAIENKVSKQLPQQAPQTAKMGGEDVVADGATALRGAACEGVANPGRHRDSSIVVGWNPWRRWRIDIGCAGRSVADSGA